MQKKSIPPEEWRMFNSSWLFITFYFSQISHKHQFYTALYFLQILWLLFWWQSEYTLNKKCSRFHHKWRPASSARLELLTCLHIRACVNFFFKKNHASLGVIFAPFTIFVWQWNHMMINHDGMITWPLIWICFCSLNMA